MNRTRVNWLLTTVAIAAAVVVTRWPFRSHTLFSWDSVNFALGVVRIDLLQHRPHPPGYLGYVLAARAIAAVAGDINTSLVIWNFVATTVAAVVLARWAWELAGDERRPWAAIVAAVVVLGSPGIWFYGEVADISASEMMWGAVVPYAAWRATRGSTRAFWWCVIALVGAACLKVVTAIFLAPVVLVAWARMPSSVRWRSAIAAVALVTLAAVVIVVRHPEAPGSIWATFRSSRWIFRGELDRPWAAFNRNVRDSLVGALALLGCVSLITLAVAAITRRRWPTGLGSAFAWSWWLPTMMVCLFVIIAKPGYLMPIVPLAVLSTALCLARLPMWLGTSLVALHVVAGSAQFLLWPAPPATAGAPAYRDKSTLAKLQSDLAELANVSYGSIVRTDQWTHDLIEAARSVCPSGDGVIVAEPEWRRVVWYLPNSIAIRLDRERAVSVGLHTDSRAIDAEGEVISTTCRVLWLSPTSDNGPVRRVPGAEVLTGIGWTSAPGTYRVTRESIDRER